jgi:hypothetical protein
MIKKNSWNNFANLPIADAIKMRFVILSYSDVLCNTWKCIPENPEYLINHTGAVRHTKSYKGRVKNLLPTIRNSKYCYVTLNVRDTRKGYLIDRLMISTFFGIPYQKIKKVKHNDGCLFNNNIENLSYEF